MSSAIICASNQPGALARLEDEFNQDAYWIERHENYRGDPRSVGNIGKSVEENLKGESRFISAVTWAAADLKPYRTVLNIGCGYGRVASCFCDAGYDYTGVDVAPVAIEAARRREPRGHFILGSALEIDLEKTFDLICVLYVFVHFVDDGDWLALIRRLSGQLTQGGSLLLADQFPEFELRPSKHVCQRPLSRYETVLEAYRLSRDNVFKEKLDGFWRLGGSPSPFELFRAQPTA
ncbi:MAG: class I SAM-dependent methyltransferase [Paracoccaceae bacterium]